VKANRNINIELIKLLDNSQVLLLSFATRYSENIGMNDVATKKYIRLLNRRSGIRNATKKASVSIPAPK
jgi:hypothetical protein